MNSKLMKLTLAGSVALALCLTGCGARQLAEPPVVEEAAAESPEPVASAEPVPTPPTAPAYEAPVVTGSLAVSGIEKKKVGGILGFRKKLEVKGTVVNTSNVPMS